jgi:hypothetical protein
MLLSLDGTNARPCRVGRSVPARLFTLGTLSRDPGIALINERSHHCPWQATDSGIIANDEIVMTLFKVPNSGVQLTGDYAKGTGSDMCCDPFIAAT